MESRAYNFNAGPAALPLEVLRQAQEQFVDFEGTGMSLMEMSHRGKTYEGVHYETEKLLRELLSIPDGYKVLFLQGGASTQFAMVPMNLLSPGRKAAYVHTGAWAAKAIKEAKMFGDVTIAATTEADGFMRIPAASELAVPEGAAYVHLTSNETIGGTQWQAYPDTGSVPLVGDLSSDILCRPLNVSQFGLIYAGAQKNLGPSGVTIVIIREDLLAPPAHAVPTMLQYATHAKSDSLYNTPPTFAVYMVNLVLKWVKSKGGAEAMERINQEKAQLLYGAIDRSGGFYRGCSSLDSRSIMNVTFRMENEELEKRFVKESEEAGFVGLKGHRDVGGLRASIYNAVPADSVRALVEFMDEFKRRNG
ncbi:3-phosphoserine/phosphohydroxythreonine transaminase [Cohnella sp. CFH 77786]|uniref:3-phosphoserine/phosphohydroxythreonine transaminase n=1 Tax=Cohnella sp. CFH 77786 TaxID=2662265 RepID=UPI001C60FC79|nr:3-phosphoserine/phosphohydroxythreonine transaminase [Cohnella sp. CFH 77786]MBW5446896.1 3-phosphoserine/phosphohydroxythreonine transaminase [Cohnella sp. CFH 77786]